MDVKIIAESGATKTDWCALLPGEAPRHAATSGINFASMGREEAEKVVAEALSLMGVNGKAAEVEFYGAGMTEEPPYLRILFPEGSTLHAHSDLLAAARALFGHSEGIAAIVGTGSNSCLYDGENTICNIRSGGFILGDEGGGACLGKMFLADLVKGLVPEELASEFARDHESGYLQIVRAVYKSPAPGAYLGAIAPWVVEKSAGSAYALSLVEENFRSFVRRALSRYGRKDLPVGVVGGFGWANREVFSRVAAEEGITVSKFLRAPMEGLIEFHR